MRRCWPPIPRCVGPSVERGDVAEAVMLLLERGEKVTTRSVRGVLGHGSLRDISAHLKTLVGEVEEEPLPCLPAPLAPQAEAPEPQAPYALWEVLHQALEAGRSAQDIAAQLEAEGVPPA